MLQSFWISQFKKKTILKWLEKHKAYLVDPSTIIRNFKLVKPGIMNHLMFGITTSRNAQNFGAVSVFPKQTSDLDLIKKNKLILVVSWKQLKRISQELNPLIHFDNKKGLGVVAKYLVSLPQLLCWWFAWLSSF